MSSPGASGRVGVLCVDLFKTLLELKQPPGEAPNWALRVAYAEAFGLSISDPILKELPEKIAEARKEVGATGNYHDHDTFWRLTNLKIGQQISKEGSSGPLAVRKARQVRSRITSDPELYELRQDTRRALRRLMRLRDRYYVVLTTNSSGRLMTNMVRRFGLNRYFDRLYSTSWIQVPKDQASFWMAMRGAFMLPVLSFMTNSIKWDAPASNFGIWVHMLDRSDTIEADLRESYETGVNGRYPPWVHLRFNQGYLRFYRDPYSLVLGIESQLEEPGTLKRITPDPDV